MNLKDINMVEFHLDLPQCKCFADIFADGNSHGNIGSKEKGTEIMTKINMAVLEIKCLKFLTDK